MNGPLSSPQSRAQTLPETFPPTVMPVPRKLLAWLTVGVAGTLLFLVIYLIEGATRPGYDAVRQTISALSFGPSGWIQRADFMLCGASVLLLAFVWRQILKGGAFARSYPIIHAVEGIGLIGVGIFTLDPLHTACLIVVVSAISIGLLVLAWRFWRTPCSRGWAVFTLVCGLWPMVLMPFFGMSLSPHSALSATTGLIERVATSPDIAWGVIMLIPLWSGWRVMSAMHSTKDSAKS